MGEKKKKGKNHIGTHSARQLLVHFETVEHRNRRAEKLQGETREAWQLRPELHAEGFHGKCGDPI